jgi:hypothetical protein
MDCVGKGVVASSLPIQQIHVSHTPHTLRAGAKLQELTVGVQGVM